MVSSMAGAAMSAKGMPCALALLVQHISFSKSKRQSEARGLPSCFESKDPQLVVKMLANRSGKIFDVVFVRVFEGL